MGEGEAVYHLSSLRGGNMKLNSTLAGLLAFGIASVGLAQTNNSKVAIQDLTLVQEQGSTQLADANEELFHHHGGHHHHFGGHHHHHGGHHHFGGHHHHFGGHHHHGHHHFGGHHHHFNASAAGQVNQLPSPEVKIEG